MKQLYYLVSISFVFVLLSSPSNAKPKRMGHAHTHGEALIDLATDGNKASVVMHIDTHSLTGFEHAPKNAAEKTAIEKVYQTFRQQISRMFIFDAKLNCRLSEKKLIMAPEGAHSSDEAKHDDDDEHEHGEHWSLQADYDINCSSTIVPGKVQIDLSTYFKEIQKLKIQILSETGAKSIELPGKGITPLE